MNIPDWPNKYYKPSEVAIHCCLDDCWLSWNNLVRNLTPLIQEYKKSNLILPIMAEAGKDISHWFDTNGEIKTFIHPLLGTRAPYLPHGPIPHLIDFGPANTKWIPVPDIPWWKNSDYVIGKLTKNVRPIRIKNMLTGTEVLINICEEETLLQILNRYLPFNSNATSYTWKVENRKLDMNLTLDENDIPDPRIKFRELDLPDDTYVPCIMIYFNDDL